MRVLNHRQPDLSVLAENVYKPHNLSAMLRTCDAVGVGEVHAVHPTGGIPTYNETSASADKWIELVVHKDIGSACEHLRDKGMRLYATHLSTKAIDYRDIDYSQASCILMGNERDGVSEEASKLVDEHIIIPMMGMVQSLNVSVATAVVMFEAYRQRREKGLYDSSQISPRAKEIQAYKWLYPRQAALLTAQGIPFPKLDEQGQVIPNSIRRLPK